MFGICSDNYYIFKGVFRMKLKYIALIWGLLVLANGGYGAECDGGKTYEIIDRDGSLHKVTHNPNEICLSNWHEKTIHQWHLFNKEVSGCRIITDGLEDGESQIVDTMATRYTPINVPSFFPGCAGKKPSKYFPDCHTATFWGWSEYTCDPESIKIPGSDVSLHTHMSQAVFEATLENNKYEFERS